MSQDAEAPACGGDEALRRSEARLRGLFENSPVSIWEEDFTAVKVILDRLRAGGVSDLEAHLRDHPGLLGELAAAIRVVDVNRAAVALHGAHSKEQLLTGLPATFTPESFQAFRREILAIWEGRLEMATPAVVQTFAGERRHVTVYYAVSAGCESTLERVIVSLVDVTEQRQAEEAMRAAERRYREVFESSADILYLLEVTADGRFRNLDVNPAFERSTGLTARQVLGKCQEEAVGHEVAQAVNAKYRRCVEAGVPVHEEAVLDLPTGRRVYASALIPIRDEAGRIYRIVGVSRDVTALRRAEEEIRTLNRELEARVTERTAELQAANDELEAFAYSVSHDLRAPVRHLDGFASLLRTRAALALDPQSLRYLDTISETAHRMGALIDDLLAFSRMGRCAMVRGQVDLASLAAEVVRDLAPEAQGRDVQWHVAGLPVVAGDRAMLRLVLVNLVGNALKFTRTRAVAQIEMGWRRGENETQLFVRDNGVGFDPKHAAKLFGVFQRLHRAEEFEGTGIGLASVRRIVTRHGGRTWAEGEPGRGATFWLALPGLPLETASGPAAPQPS